MSTSAKRLLLGTTTAIIAMAAAAMPAAAKKGHHHHHHHFRTFPLVVTSGYAGCEHYYWKWKRTGIRAWRSKYLACIG